MPDDLVGITVTGVVFIIFLSIVYMIDAWPEIRARNEQFKKETRERQRTQAPKFYRESDPSPKRIPGVDDY